jgi:hypothetical protein
MGKKAKTIIRKELEITEEMLSQKEEIDKIVLSKGDIISYMLNHYPQDPENPLAAHEIKDVINLLLDKYQRIFHTEGKLNFSSFMFIRNRVEPIKIRTRYGIANGLCKFEYFVVPKRLAAKVGRMIDRDGTVFDMDPSCVPDMEAVRKRRGPKNEKNAIAKQRRKLESLESTDKLATTKTPDSGLEK